jgi:Alpha/beta hydrolase domain
MLESLDVTTTEPYVTHSYEWVTGVAHFAVDPASPANTRIVDLDVVETDDDGKVRFEADVRMLRPIGEAGDRALLIIPNRGMVGGVPFSSYSAATSFTAASLGAAPDPGDGFLLEKRWTIAWCGWQWDVLRESGGLGLAAPMANVAPGLMRSEFRPDVDEQEHLLTDATALFTFSPYPVAYLDDPDASLSVRTSPLGEKQRVPRDRWHFVDSTHVTLEGGFRAFHWYEVVYRSALAPVAGTGLLATRDFGSFLGRSHDHVLAYGVSQSGRFLREFLHTGLNLDENDHQVFEGIFSHIASARQGEFNIRYAQPSVTHPLNPGYGPPYDTGALLELQRSLGGSPKVFFTNSSWEYWRGDGALVHQDAITGDDLPEDPDGRAYLISGTDHYGNISAMKDLMPLANPTHGLDAGPILRALFVQLEQWVCEGVAPAPSCVPRLSDGSALPRPEALTAFHDAHLPNPSDLPYTPVIDADSTTWPLELGQPLVALVSSVDASGNEVAGIRLPAVAVPVAAYTGWNPRVHVDGLPDVLYEFVGSLLPLQSGTVPVNRASYESELTGAAHRLVAQRFLLERDVDQTVAEGMRLYDRHSPRPDSTV